MALIDQTYFVGDLTIAGLDRPAVVERLNLFIEKYQDEFLRSVFGYSMYKALLDGLSQVSIEQKWMDILEGKEFDYSGYTRQWRGLVMVGPGQSISVNPAGRLELVVDRGQSYDPIAGQMTISLPPAYQGVYFTIERRATGTLRSDEYSINLAGDTLTLTNLPAWNSGETIFLTKSATIGISGEGMQPRSPIANFVYWHYIKDQTTQTVGLGQAQSKAENASIVSPATKMVRAWNEMSEWMENLYSLLQDNQDIYPDWISSDKALWKLAPQNVFGI